MLFNYETMWVHKTMIHIHVLSLCWCSMSHTLISVPASLLAPGYKLIMLQIHHFYVFMFHFQKLKNENITPGSQTSLVGWWGTFYTWSCWYLSQEQTPIVCLTCCLDSCWLRLGWHSDVSDQAGMLRCISGESRYSTIISGTLRLELLQIKEADVTQRYTRHKGQEDQFLNEESSKNYILMKM